MVVAPLHELPGGGLLRGAGPLIQYYSELKQDCSTYFINPTPGHVMWQGALDIWRYCKESVAALHQLLRIPEGLRAFGYLTCGLPPILPPWLHRLAWRGDVIRRWYSWCVRGEFNERRYWIQSQCKQWLCLVSGRWLVVVLSDSILPASRCYFRLGESHILAGQCRLSQPFLCQLLFKTVFHHLGPLPA